MSAEEIDDYLRGVEEPKRTTLQALRRTILDVIPDAEQGISYGMPAFRIQGKTVAGFAAFKDHLSYLPHSGTVLGQLADDLAGYTMTKGSLHSPSTGRCRRLSCRGLSPCASARLTDARGETLWSSSRFRAQLIDGIQRQSGFRIAMRLPTAPNIRTVGY